MTDWIAATLGIVLIISILIALILYRRSKQQKDNVEKENAGQSLSNMLGSMRNTDELKAPLNSQIANKPSTHDQPIESDKQFFLERFSEIRDQIESLYSVVGKSSKQPELSVEMPDILNGIKNNLETLNTKISTRQARQLSNVDRQFIEQIFSQLTAPLETKISNISCDHVQAEEISKIFNTTHDDLIRKLKNVLDSHDYKECTNCRYATVPKSAKFCPDCGHSLT